MYSRSQDAWPQALLLDFYDTVVRDDSAIIGAICDEVARAARAETQPDAVGVLWSEVFHRLCVTSHGRAFKSQKQIERISLEHVLTHFGADLDPDGLCTRLFAYWARPELYAESTQVLARCDLPICVVSDIDNRELASAIRFCGLRFDYTVTSEDCRAYKPRPEMFQRACKVLGLPYEAVLHVGDSLGNDVAGAQALGIPVLWVNRQNRPAPQGDAAPDYVSPNLSGLALILQNR